MCIEVLEHVPEPSLAIKELARILKPNGVLLITAPFCSLTHFAPYHFSTGFNRYFYETLLKANGLKILEIMPNGNYYEYMAQELRRLPGVIGEYSNSKMNIFENISVKLVLRSLNKYSKKDKGSSELLCFGYHIFAQKII
jgi:ubiquinone/menaquinone biosynthesis C-methylase UbiE